MKKLIISALFLLTLNLYPSLLGLTSVCAQKLTVESKFDTNTLYPPSSIVIPDHNDWTKGHYKDRIAEFKANPLEFGDVVFIGNSITEQGGDWAKRFDNAKVKNRGIAGDVTAGVIARLKEIYYYKPEKVFLKIGVNDLFHSDLKPEYVANNIKLIVAMIHQESPKTKIYVQTILPSRDNNPSKERIAATNAILKSMTSTDFLQVIDLHSAFTDQNDLMISEYTHDGLHLNEAGYEVWQNFIKEFVNEGKTTSYVKKVIDATLKPSVVFTSAMPVSTSIGTVLKVNYRYTANKETNIYCGISLLNDWTWVSFVGGEGKKLPAGTDVEGSFDITIPKGTKPSADLKDKLNYKINIEMKSLPDYTWLAGDYPATPLNLELPSK
ncbi:GDSL-type esterase/lipase family protein [Flavobacterium luteum]|nr:GDSL-type esterase/lipase family protein [Flavobacterium luteum]